MFAAPRLQGGWPGPLPDLQALLLATVDPCSALAAGRPVGLTGAARSRAGGGRAAHGRGRRGAQGMIQPTVPEGTQASVFAVFDDKKKLQFVGFSKDVRNSLRTVFSRRPDRAFFYKRAPAPPAPSPGAHTCRSPGQSVLTWRRGEYVASSTHVASEEHAMLWAMRAQSTMTQRAPAIQWRVSGQSVPSW